MILREIEELIRPSIERMGYELWGTEYHKQGFSALLRIYIDSSAGIGITDCEQVSRQTSALLDVHDPIPGEYRLEISSPGIPRPLFYPHQYQRYFGQTVQIKLSRTVSGKRNIVGVILSADDAQLTLKVDESEHTFLFSNILKAHLIVERGTA